MCGAPLEMAGATAKPAAHVRSHCLVTHLMKKRVMAAFDGLPVQGGQ